MTTQQQLEQLNKRIEELEKRLDKYINPNVITAMPDNNGTGYISPQSTWGYVPLIKND